MREVLSFDSVTFLVLTIGNAFALCFVKSPAATTAVLYRALRHKSGRKRCWLNAVIRGPGESRPREPVVAPVQENPDTQARVDARQSRAGVKLKRVGIAPSRSGRLNDPLPREHRVSALPMEVL
jgi:hypothetical protein